MKRRGINRDGYQGEQIDASVVLPTLIETASRMGWSVESLDGPQDRPLCALTRPAIAAPGTHPRHVYLSAGIHADEPAGILALFDLIRSDTLPRHAEYRICPCLNPGGFRSGSRFNPEGIDLNRDYNHLRSHEVRAHVQWLSRQPPFDLSLLLHEDWESGGFYLYELNPNCHPPLAEAVIEAVAQVCPIEHAEVIDGRPSHAPGIIRPSADPATRPDWPEAIWLTQRGCHQSLTLEAPSDFPLATRVAALTSAILRALA